MGLLRGILFAWIALSFAAAIFGNLAFFVWLRGQGVPVRFMYAGTPGYLDRHYSEWCASRGLSARRVLMLRVILLVNVMLAALVRSSTW